MPRQTAAVIASAIASALSTSSFNTLATPTHNVSSSSPPAVFTGGAERAVEAKFIAVEHWLAGVVGVGAGLGML